MRYAEIAIVDKPIAQCAGGHGYDGAHDPWQRGIDGHIFDADVEHIAHVFGQISHDNETAAIAKNLLTQIFLSQKQ